jgi:hypothetical protein
MFLNGGLAIDAGPPGRTANDPTASTLPINHPDELDLSLEDDAVVLRACVAPGSRVEVFEALVESDGTAGPFRFLTHGVEGGAEDTDTSTACSEFNDAAFELSLPIEGPIVVLVLTATDDGQTSELSDPVALIDDAVPSQDCGGYADCGPERPICDSVFRRCVLCLDDAVDDGIDTGCSTQTPRCNGELSGRSCEPPSLTTGTPRERPNPDPSTGCSLTPQDENPTKSLLWCLIGFAVLRKKRFKARSIS